MLLWLAGLGGAIAASAWLAGDPRFALPDSLAAASAWLQHAPLDAVTALALRALLAVGGWLLVTTLLALATRAVGAVRAARVLDRVTPALVRRLAGTAVSAAIGVGVGLPPAVAAPIPGPAVAVPTPAVDAGQVEEAPLLRLVSPAARPVGAAISTALDRPGHAPSRTPVPSSPAREEQPDPAPPPPPDADDTTGAARSIDEGDGPARPAERTWTVGPGDHLWSIAEAVVTAHDATASEREVARYWRLLVDANRRMLVDPDDPDLILPGQVVELPRR